ncbi:hypothetical protein PV684_49845 [Streptomyces sp. AK02-04a]|nr:hypothetical protein [Streptomyces sp. AK02-04a]
MRTILTESADLLPAIVDSDLCGEGTVVFSPSSENRTDIGETIVAPYTGSLSSPGDEIVVGEVLVVKVQEYALTPHLAVTGPTFARITSKKDFCAFLDHADQAHQHGLFPQALLHPMIRLGDLCALGGSHTCGGPRQRLFIRASGQASTTPHGMPLGAMTDGLASLTTVWSAFRRPPSSGCPVCLSEAVPAPILRIAHRQRPWLSRYLYALEALRTAASLGLTQLKVSGFPHRLTGAQDRYTPAADFTPAGADMPLLLFNSSIAVLHDPRSNQQFQIGEGTARLIELLLIHGDLDSAVSAATHRLGLAPHAARDALAQVTSGLNFGMQPSTTHNVPGIEAKLLPTRYQHADARSLNASCWLSAMGVAAFSQSIQLVPGPRVPG